MLNQSLADSGMQLVQLLNERVEAVEQQEVLTETVDGADSHVDSE